MRRLTVSSYRAAVLIKSTMYAMVNMEMGYIQPPARRTNCPAAGVQATDTPAVSSPRQPQHTAPINQGHALFEATYLLSLSDA